MSTRFMKNGGGIRQMPFLVLGAIWVVDMKLFESAGRMYDE